MSRTTPSVDAKASRSSKSTDLLDLLSSGEPPAFANDQNHRIIFWNKGAEKLLERTAAQALGRLCHEIFCGKDPFGNRFCGGDLQCDLGIPEARNPEPLRDHAPESGRRRSRSE